MGTVPMGHLQSKSGPRERPAFSFRATRKMFKNKLNKLKKILIYNDCVE